MFSLKNTHQVFLTTLIFLGMLSVIQAATITVTNGNDSGSGSLRNAISSAVSGDNIIFSGVSTVSLTSGEITLDKTLTIDGGAAGVTITRTGSTQFRLFNIPMGTVTFNKINLTNGYATDVNGGGAILAGSGANLIFTTCNLTNNTATAGGGAISLNGTATFTNCSLNFNTSTNTLGGAILMYPPGVLNFTGCTVAGNANGSGGAALDLRGGGGGNTAINMTNSTLSTNSQAAIILGNNECTGTFNNVTITNNGIGISSFSNNCTLKNSIIADNLGADIFSPQAFNGVSSFNLIGSPGGSGITNGSNGNIVNVTDAGLLTLANNGGITLTHALSPCSPAVNAGTNAGAPSTDQRGNTRPFGGTVDMGAYELQSAPGSISVNASVTNVLCNGASTGSISLMVSGGSMPYTYAWTGTGSGTNPRTNLAAGTYTVTVTDNTGCVATRVSTVTQPAVALTVSGTSTPVTCFGGNNGAISLNVSGGTGSYTYAWTGTGTGTNPRTDLTAGTYTVTVTDDNGCSRTRTNTVTQNPIINLSATPTNASCGSSTGSIQVTVSGGTPGYIYVWSDGITTDSRTGLAPGTYTVTVTDNSGCTRTAMATVGGQDNVPPTITCPANATVSGDINNNYTLPNVTANATVSDNCPGNPGVTQSPAVGTVVALGPTTITLTATDGAGNSATCSYVITVVPGCSAPIVTCTSNKTIVAGANCTASLPSYVSQTTVANGCGNNTVTQSPAAGTTLSQGAHVITMLATDANGNTGTCTFSVTVADQTAPSITCPANTTVAAGANCSATLASFTGAATAADNCTANPSITQSPVAGTTFTGSQTVTLMATDAAGNSAACSFVVTVADQTAPSITCPANTTVAAGANCSATLTNYAASVSATDNCAANPNETQSPAAGTTFTGSQTVTLTATDAAGNSATCSFVVTIADQTAPSITCPANTTVAAGTNCSATLANYAATVSATDNCAANPNETQSPAAGTTFTGSQTVTLIATDAAGNSAICSFAVTVVDQTAPSITCPANTTVAVGGVNCNATLANYAATVSATDNCTANPNEGQSPVSGTTISGVQVVTLTATDAAGNSSTCSFNVTAIDMVAPTVTCQPFVTTLGANGTVTVTTANVYQSGSDNCGGVTPVSVTPSTLTCTNIGLTTVVLTVSDNSGNTATCTTVVKLSDNLAPTVVCKNFTASLNAAGTATIIPANVYQSGTDNCGTVAPILVTPATFNCSNLGNNVVTLTAIDGSANQGTCTAIVTITDPVAPVALCKNAIVSIPNTGSASVTTTMINNGTTDNCSFTLAVSPATFTCAQLGLNTVVLTATDASGNTATCSATVTVRDLTGPVAICKNATIFLNSTGEATLNPSQVDNGSYDACGIADMTVSDALFNCSDIGTPIAVFLRVRDINGNLSTCTSYVTVRDNTAPTASCQDVQVTLGANGKVAVYGASLAAASTDNCGVWSYTPIAKVYTTANLGVNYLTITVKDWSGNAATCVSEVTVFPNDNFGGNGNGTQSVNDEEEDLEIEILESEIAEELTNLQPSGNLMELDNTKIEVSIYPNPTMHDAFVEFQLPNKSDYRVVLLDATGRLAYLSNGFGAEGYNRLVLPMSELPSGVYFMELRAGALVTRKQLIRQE